MNERLSLLRNTARGGKSVTLRLIGQKTNRSAIGAVAHLRIGKRTLTQEVRSGSTFMSHSDLRLHLGLGGASTVDAVEVQWPDGQLEKIGPLAAEQIATITEGKGVTASVRYVK